MKIVRGARVLLLVAAVHICQFGEARAPVVQGAVVLISVGAGGVQRAEGGGLGPAAFVIEDEEGVVRGSRRVVVSGVQVLNTGRANKAI
ncbi:hypothetical protein FKM82_001918 [Ascaphus truei]